MSKNTVITVVVVAIITLMVAPHLRKLPLVNKIPTV